MLGIQPFKNFYKWGCLFLGIPVDVFRQDGLMVQLRAVRSTRHYGAQAHREVLDEELNDSLSHLPDSNALRTTVMVTRIPTVHESITHPDSDDEGEDAYPRYYVATRSRAHSY